MISMIIPAIADSDQDSLSDIIVVSREKKSKVNKKGQHYGFHMENSCQGFYIFKEKQKINHHILKVQS